MEHKIIKQMIAGTGTESDIETFAAKFIEDNMDEWLNVAMGNLCEQYNGVMDSDNQCRFKQSDCDINIPLGPHDIARHWSHLQNKCLSVNAALKGICNSNGLPYNVDTGICEITPELCREKGGDPKMGSDGHLEDCEIPLGQEIAEAIFGTTIVRGFKQIFDMDQYKPCDADQIENEYLCRDKCRPGYHDVAGVCWTGDVSITTPDSCNSS